MRLESSTSSAAVSSGWRPISRRKSCSASVVVSRASEALGGAVGLVMVDAGERVDAAYLADATWEVDVAGRSYPARASLRPLYDPNMERIKR